MKFTFPKNFLGGFYSLPPSPPVSTPLSGTISPRRRWSSFALERFKADRYSRRGAKTRVPSTVRTRAIYTFLRTGRSSRRSPRAPSTLHERLTGGAPLIIRVFARVLRRCGIGDDGRRPFRAPTECSTLRAHPATVTVQYIIRGVSVKTFSSRVWSGNFTARSISGCRRTSVFDRFPPTGVSNAVTSARCFPKRRLAPDQIA